MNGLLLILTMYAVDITACLLLLRFGLKGCSLMVVTNAILLTTIGSQHVSVFGMPVGVGCVFMSSAMFGMTVVAYKNGLDGVQRLLRSMLVALLSVQAFVLLEWKYASLPDWFEHGAALSTGLYMGFYFAALANAVIIKKHSDLVGKILANLVAQTISSFLFFHISFSGLFTEPKLLQMSAIGALAMFSLNLLDTPAYLLWKHLYKHDLTLPHNCKENCKFYP